MKKNNQVVKQVEYHRNGISGVGFHVAIMEETEDGEKRNMLVIRFPKETDKQCGGVVCAAFDLKLLAEQNILFGMNSWRGDRYHETMDKAIAKSRKQF